MFRPQVRYAPAGDGTRLGYTVTGDGPTTVTVVPSLLSEAESLFEEPTVVQLLARVTTGARLVIIERRGTGLSDRPRTPEDLGLRQVGHDIQAVLDHVGVDRTVLMAHSSGGPGAIHFAGSRPGRTTGLVLIGSCAKNRRGDGYPLGPTAAELRHVGLTLAETWGTVADSYRVAPSVSSNQRFVEWMAWQERRSFPPGAVPGVIAALGEHDARSDLARVDAPTLVVHRRHDPVWDIGHGRYLADNIRGAKLRELPGHDHLLYAPGQSDLQKVLGRFLDGLEPARRGRRRDWTGLTDTEREVAHLVALGLANKQIAAERTISPNTVDAHLRSIYRKMQVRNRTELARRMVSERLA